jgi:hypothetical protein
MVYRTKTGSNFRIFVGFIISISVVGLAFLVMGEAFVGLAVLTVGLFLVALVLQIVWPMEYDPGASGADGEPILLIRCGRLHRYNIPLAEISEVLPSFELLSSPASCSYDRIKVVYPSRSGVYRSLLISPRDRDGFLDELARRANQLERDGDSLVRIRSCPPAGGAIVNRKSAFGGIKREYRCDMDRSDRSHQRIRLCTRRESGGK